MILPNTGLGEAKSAADRMVSAMSSRPTNWNRDEIPLSVSVGVGEYGSDMNPEDITSKSDEALYMAKQAGKNTVRLPLTGNQAPLPRRCCWVVRRRSTVVGSDRGP